MRDQFTNFKYFKLKYLKGKTIFQTKGIVAGQKKKKTKEIVKGEQEINLSSSTPPLKSSTPPFNYPNNSLKVCLDKVNLRRKVICKGKLNYFIL